MLVILSSPRLVLELQKEQPRRYYQNEEQERVVRSVMAKLEAEGLWPDPFVTEVAPLTRFFPAEPYHVDYYRRNAGQPYCQVVISPKLAKVRREFAHRIRGTST